MHKVAGALLLLSSICGLGYSQELTPYEREHQVWDWLSWSADPKHWPTGKTKLPSGWVTLYYKSQPVGLLEPNEGLWLSLSSGEEFNLRQHTQKYNPKQKTNAVPAIREEETPKDGDQVIPHAQSCFGVDSRKIATKETFHLEGRICSRAEALEAIKRVKVASGIPTDADATRITVIGTEAQTKTVMDDLDKAPELQWLKGNAIVQAYTPDHWRIIDGGFVNTGTPTIYAQSPDGVVLWRQDNYEGGANALSQALRDRVPGYDPTKDPTPKQPNKPNDNGGNWMPKISLWWIVAIVVAVLCLRNKL